MPIYQKQNNQLIELTSEILGGGGPKSPYNTEEWITESGEWSAPVTGWYDVLLLGGGCGARVVTGEGWVLPGRSGEIEHKLMYLSGGDLVPVIIGTGGVGETAASWASSDAYLGGGTSFGDFSTNEDNNHRFMSVGIFDTRINSTADLGFSSVGGGLGGGLSYPSSLTGAPWDANFYGAGAGGSITRSSGQTNVSAIAGNGGPGAVRLRYYDPNKEENN